MKQLSRAEVIQLLQEHTPGLRCTNSFKTSTLDRTIGDNWSQDRHISIGQFKDNTKTEDSFIQSNLLFFEIDDLDLKYSKDKSLQTLEKFCYSHVLSVVLSLKEFCSRVSMDLDFNPFLATFSGSKSFHILFKFDEYLSKEEYLKCRKVWLEFCKVAQKFPSRYPKTLLVDPQVPFSHAHCPRISCEIQEDNRLPQISFELQLTNTLSICKKDFMKIVETHERINKFMEPRKIVGNRFLHYSTFSKESLEHILNKNLQETNNPDKFLIECVHPNHDDNNKSAFITLKGFIYCSKCCVGKPWISRVKINGEIIHNE